MGGGKRDICGNDFVDSGGSGISSDIVRNAEDENVGERDDVSVGVYDVVAIGSYCMGLLIHGGRNHDRDVGAGRGAGRDLAAGLVAQATAWPYSTATLTPTARPSMATPTVPVRDVQRAERESYGGEYRVRHIYVERFRQGAVDAGAPRWLVDHLVNVVVPCEHGWGPPRWDNATGATYFGWLQFLRSTWDSVALVTGYWDWSDAYSQGYNGAWLAMNSNPSTQWPVCWGR